MGYGGQVAEADRERRLRQSSLFRSPWCRPGARARAPQCRDPSGRSSGAGRPRGLATADRDLVYRGTSLRADTARHACASRSPESVLFLPGVQAISGMPPHRYHNSRRIEQAKTLWPSLSCRNRIGLTVGFSETSSFTAAFRKATGQTPTGYHRSLR
jgi:AraC-type DNA-binding domain-containing proteins